MSSKIEVKRICQYCNKEFTARTTVTKYCSKQCNSKAYKAKERAEKIERSNKEVEQLGKEYIEGLNAKELLNVNEACQLLGISRRTVYRLINKGEISIIKIGRRTIIKRSTLNRLIDNAEAIKAEPLQVESTNQEQIEDFEISEAYCMKDILSKYDISEKALYEMIKRERIPKKRQGKFTYVPKKLIDNLLK